ncbi:unnamed protein product [Pleuronectes platessa]|uniref:Uncharacterized protein n=1 Tax=Pleuronectes platessa TaxID=8262 RepID=A0A9N7TT84_PLEPL|nr:unnamed protein product [Pleuronectes platessa]
MSLELLPGSRPRLAQESPHSPDKLAVKKNKAADPSLKVTRALVSRQEEKLQSGLACSKYGTRPELPLSLPCSAAGRSLASTQSLLSPGSSGCPLPETLRGGEGPLDSSVRNAAVDSG